MALSNQQDAGHPATNNMIASGSTSASQAASTWTEPPWQGWIETTGDALLILEAARRGLIPRVTRRLVDSERKMITSGSVFVFDEDESGIKRWTDGFFWSPSRILGNFLLYRETDKRGSGHRTGRATDPSPSEPAEQSQYNIEGGKVEGQTLSRPKSEGQAGSDRNRERTLVGSLTNSYKFKPDGLMKKTFSLTISGVSQHLISYYKIEDVEGGRLRSPSSLPELASLSISPEYLDKTLFRNPPKVEIGPDGMPRYRGEADDVDTTPSLLPAPLSSGLPLLTDGTEGLNKRNKRFDPYGTTVTNKRSRKVKGGQPQPSGSDLNQAASPTAQQPVSGFSDPNLPIVQHHHYPPYNSLGYYQMPGYPVPPPPHPHMYPPSSYSGAVQGTAGLTSVPPPQGAPGPQSQPHQQHPYHTYPPPPHGIDPSQIGTTGQQPFYPYYPPPPPGHYPGYAGVAWPHYAGYPPQPVVQQQQQHQQAAPAPAPNTPDDGNKDAAGGQDIGGGATVPKEV